MKPVPKIHSTYTTLYKVWAAIEGEPMRLHEAMGYQYEPHLVPVWQEGPGGMWRRPERIISLKPFGLVPLTDDPDGADFRVERPIPLAVWSGPESRELTEKYGVRFRPPARMWNTNPGIRAPGG